MSNNIDIRSIVDSLVFDVNAGEYDIPDTAADARVNADREGRIGILVCQLMQDRFRRFHDSLMVFNGNRWILIEPEAVSMIIAGFLVKVKVAPCYVARSVDRIYKMVIRDHHIPNFEPHRNIIFMQNCALVLGKGGAIERMEKSADLMTNIYLDFP